MLYGVRIYIVQIQAVATSPSTSVNQNGMSYKPQQSAQTIPLELVYRVVCCLSWATKLLTASVVAAHIAVADLRVGTGLCVWHGVRENGAREQQSRCGDEGGELHGDLEALLISVSVGRWMGLCG